jgi:hypothetical protein
MFNAGGRVSQLPHSPPQPPAHERRARGLRAMPRQEPQRVEVKQPRGRSKSPSKPQQSGLPLLPVCRVCLRKISPSDVAAFVSHSFDPSKPSHRRKR